MSPPISRLDFSCGTPQHGTFAHNRAPCRSRSINMNAGPQVRSHRNGETMECRVARGGVTFVALFFLATSLFAQTATKSPAQPRADAIRAMFDVHEFEQASISPDGKRVA